MEMTSTHQKWYNNLLSENSELQFKGNEDRCGRNKNDEELRL